MQVLSLQRHKMQFPLFHNSFHSGLFTDFNHTYRIAIVTIDIYSLLRCDWTRAGTERHDP